MRLHLLVAVFAVFSGVVSLGLCADAHADATGGIKSDGVKTDTAKSLEATPGQGTPVRAAKVSARFSTQVQLFIEQKEAPIASKTSIGTQGTSRVSQKSKD